MSKKINLFKIKNEKKMPSAGIEPASSRPQREVLTTILTGPKAFLLK